MEVVARLYEDALPTADAPRARTYLQLSLSSFTCLARQYPMTPKARPSKTLACLETSLSVSFQRLIRSLSITAAVGTLITVDEW